MVVALILSAGLSILVLSFWGLGGFSWDVSAINFIAVVLFLAGLFVLRKFKTNPIFIMLGCGAIGGVFYLLF